MAKSMTPESNSAMLCRLYERSAWRKPNYVCKGGLLRDYFRLLYSKLLSVNRVALEKHSYYTYFMLCVSRFNGLLLCFEFCCYLFFSLSTVVFFLAGRWMCTVLAYCSAKCVQENFRSRSRSKIR